MERITKTAIRNAMNFYDAFRYLGKAKNNKDHHSCTVLIGADNLKEWFKSRRISYTESVGFYKDGSAYHHFTVNFNQLPYLNQTNRTN